MPFLYDDVGEARAGILGQNLPNSLTGEVRYESLSECEETVDQIYGLYHHDDYDGEESNRTGLHPGYPSRSTSVEPYDTNELLELDGEDQLSQINESVLSRSESDIVMDQIYQHLGMETPPEADFLSDEGSDGMCIATQSFYEAFRLLTAIQMSAIKRPPRPGATQP